ncbi:hypothetical protein FPV67DRAFT_1412821, partial [Lyophyllum atratum]
RQALGFEGDDLKNKERAEALRRAGLIPADHVDDSDMPEVYLVRSASQPDHFYTIDLDAYTCTCPWYSLIDFCKHIAAVQQHYPETSIDRPRKPSVPNDTEVILAPLHQKRPCSSISNNSQQLDHDPHDISSFAMKLERLADKLCLHATLLKSNTMAHIYALEDNINTALAQVLPHATVLPRHQQLPPNKKNEWAETKQRMVRPLPKKKARSKPAGDAAYGGGERSGKKVKLLLATQPVAPAPTVKVLPATQPVALAPTVTYFQPGQYYQ